MFIAATHNVGSIKKRLSASQVHNCGRGLTREGAEVTMNRHACSLVLPRCFRYCHCSHFAEVFSRKKTQKKKRTPQATALPSTSMPRHSAPTQEVHGVMPW